MTTLSTLLGDFIEPLQPSELSAVEQQLLDRVKYLRLHFKTHDKTNRPLVNTFKCYVCMDRLPLMERLGLDHWTHLSSRSDAGRDHLKSLFRLLFTVPPPRHAESYDQFNCVDMQFHPPDAMESTPEEQQSALLARDARERALVKELEDCLSLAPASANYVFDTQKKCRRAHIQELHERLQALAARLHYAQCREPKISPIGPACPGGVASLFSS